MDFEKFNELPAEIFLEIFKFLPADCLMEFVLSCRRFYKIFDFFKNKTLVFPSISLKKIRLEYVNNALNKHLKIDNHLSVFNNLVKLQNDDFKKHYFGKADRAESFSSNFKEFQARFYQRIGSSRKVVEEILNFTNEKDYEFVIAGSSILNCLTSGAQDFNDLDIFLIRGKNDEYDDEKRVDNEIKDFLIDKLKHVITSKFYLFMNRSYLTICLEPDDQGISPPAIQINFRSCRTIEELLSMFDLDCCRFAFDGKENVYTTHQGLRFLNIGCNYIHEDQKNICFRNRLEKYWKRGIDTIFTDSVQYYHPFILFFNDKEFRTLTQDVSYSKNRQRPPNHPKYYGITYEKSIGSLFTYPVYNFPVTFSNLKERHLDSMDFHKDHECIDKYDKHSYFILDNFDDLSGHPNFGNYMKPRNLMEFQDYFYFYRGSMTYTGSQKMKYQMVVGELKMLDFKYCKECLVFFDGSKAHKCSREKEIKMSKMFMDDDDDDFETSSDESD